MKRAFALAAALALGLASSCATLAPEAPDLVFWNATVWTVDDARPAAEAVAIRGERIVAVGSNGAVRALAGPSTRVIDLQGAMLLPGFNDAHTHFGNAIEWYFQAMLMRVDTQEQVIGQLREATARVPKGAWITGGDWGMSPPAARGARARKASSPLRRTSGRSTR